MTEEKDFPVIPANVAQIAHAGIEFIIDFKRMGPEAPTPAEAKVLARVVMHPAVAKSFRDALAENIRKYEEKFGEIPPPPKAAGEQTRTMH